MKKNQLFQFSLTVICSMVLAACGSSGGSSNPTTQATNTTPASNTPVAQPQPTTTPEVKSEVANAAASDNQDKQTLKTPEVPTTEFIGYKHVSKNASNFVIDPNADKSGSDAPVGMNVKNPNRAFDTLVVAEPLQQEANKPAKVGYLEDFDFRLGAAGTASTVSATTATATTAATAAAGDFIFTGLLVEKGKTTTDNNGTPDKGAAGNAKPWRDRTPAEGKGGDAKTDTIGTDVAKALVYKENLLNYTDTHFDSAQVVSGLQKQSDGSYKEGVAPAPGVLTTEALSRSQLSKNGGYATASDQKNNTGTKNAGLKYVAEVYGYRTFPQTGANANFTASGNVKDENVNNLPLENKQLAKVQYGRVTTHLSDHTTFNDFKKGINLGSNFDTYVVDYGTFGSEGTEDHYFYRGVDAITPEQLAKFKTEQANKGKLHYWGHAVSYGLNNYYDGNQASTNAPTAIGNTQVGKFVSGNHAHAVLDLAKNTVDGSIYNVWFKVTDTTKQTGSIYNVDLVRFEGTLGDNGNIAGTSVRQDNKAQGVFGANLYGSNAAEMGGIVASNDKTPTGKWGAVFGAVRHEAATGGIQNATQNSGPGAALVSTPSNP